MLLPTLGFGLGLGDIHLRSALNQQLDAEIELLSVEPSDVSQIAASLASYDTFTKLGIDRPAVLMLMDFEVRKRPNGTHYIKVKSKQLINEPFLDFLVEVSWPSGKVMREYTLLLDPPSMSAQQEPPVVEAPQVVEAPAVVTPPQAALPVPEPVVSAPVDLTTAPLAAAPSTDRPSAQADAEPQPQSLAAPEMAAQEQTTDAVPAVSTAEALAALAAPAQQATAETRPEEKALVEPAPAPVSSEAMVYGPVKRNDALYRIANRMRPDNVSVEQMMLALYNSNRDAFINNNINLLRKGAVLRIDDPATLKALSHAEARREVARHGSAWEEYRSKVAARTPKSVPAEAPAEPAKAGGVAAATEEPKLSLTAPSKPEDTKQSKLSGTAESGVEAEALRKELLLANESVEANRKENEELNKRLKELEGQLTQMQKLLTLKDDNLAAMQQKLATSQNEAATAKAATESAKQAAATASAPALVEPAPVQSQPIKAAETPSETAVAATPVEGAAAAQATEAAPESTAPKTAADAAATTSENAAPAAAEGAAPAAAPTQDEPPKPKPRKTPVVVFEPEPEPSFIDDLLNNPLFSDPMMLGVGGAGLIIILLGIMVIMKRRKQGHGFQESILTVGTATSSMMKGKGDNPASETSFLSDLAISGVSGRVHEESDVDPLTEADVYMAYNKFKPAEDLLQEALSHNPGREELHAKLLEVYYKSKNREAFEQLAQQRSASMQNNEGLWRKVVSMGHELAPDNPLFKGAAVAGGAAIVAAAASNQTSAAASDVFDIGLDLDALSSEMEEAGAGSSGLNTDLGLDFSDFGMDTTAQAEEPAAESTSLDFDLSGFGGSEPAVAEESPSLDFDLSSFAGDSATEIVASEPMAAEEPLGGLDFDLSSMSGEPAAEESAVSLNFGDFDLGSVAVEEPAVEVDTSFDLGSLDIGGGDELSAMGDGLDFGSLDLSGASAEQGMDLGDFGDLGDLGDLGDDSSLGGMDEIGTKLDLAKAYVDMGDAEGARGMLEEVIQEGSDDQRQQAKELLEQIA